MDAFDTWPVKITLMLGATAVCVFTVATALTS